MGFAAAALEVAAFPSTGAAEPNASEPNTGPRVNGESLTTTTTRNGPAEQFGERGQVAISSEVGLTIENTSISGGNGSTTNIQLEPALDYFLARELSVGLFVLFDYTSASAGHSDTFGIGPRVGYNFTISDLLSVWPKAGLSFESNSSTTSVSLAGAPPGTSTSTTISGSNLALNLFVPLMFHPARHFFVGFGPFLDTDLSGDARATTWGGKMTIGGWFF
ncbi:MAG: hypothetical protein ACRENE_08680 [Polyangiaceae bacterium]